MYIVNPFFAAITSEWTFYQIALNGPVSNTSAGVYMASAMAVEMGFRGLTSFVRSHHI